MYVDVHLVIPIWSIWPGNTTLADTNFSHIAGDMYHYIRSIDHISFNSIHSYGKSNFQTHSYTISNFLALVDIPKYCINSLVSPCHHWNPIGPPSFDFFCVVRIWTLRSLPGSETPGRHRGHWIRAAGSQSPCAPFPCVHSKRPNVQHVISEQGLETYPHHDLVAEP